MSKKEPWVLAKEGKAKELEKVLSEAVSNILRISYLLQPFLPETGEKIEKIFTAKKIKKGEPLFPRLS